MTTNFSRLGSRFLKLGRWALVVSLLYYSGYSWAATLHAIIVADTLDPELNAKMDRDNIQTLLQNVSQATGLTLAVKVIEEHDIEPHGGGREKVMTAVEGISVMPSEDVIVFYYAGHGINTTPSGGVGGSRWPALEVEGLNTPAEQLVEFSLVKKMLQDKNPRFLMAIADTCNEFDLSRGRGEKILGSLEPGTEEAYRQLFLHNGSVIASGAVSGMDASGDKNGGYFTQALLNSLKKELKSANPDWTKLMVNASQLTQEYRPKQIPQAEVDGNLIMLTTNTDGNNESGGSDQNLAINQSGSSTIIPPEVQVFCPESSSTVGGCYWKEDGNKKWNVFVEAKGWLNQWQGWYYQRSLSDNSSNGHFISATTDPKLVPLLTLGGRYDKLSVALTFLSESYTFPKISSWRKEWWSVGEGENKRLEELLVERQSQDTAERVETDVTLGYSILPELQIGIGFKRATLDYDFHGVAILPDSTIFPNGTKKPYDQVPGGEYKIYGLSLNIGGQTCLANWLNVNVSMFGNFSYGALKTKWGEDNSDYTTYHSTDLGLSWELPRWQQWTPEIRFGYRAQTLYTETPAGDAVDTTEGFTLGLRLVF